MIYEVKQQTIVYNDNERPFRYIKCDDEMVTAIYNLGFSSDWYETPAEALNALQNICPIVGLTTGTYNGIDRNGHFGNTNSMYNDGKYYYVGDFYGTQGEIINMNGKVYNADRTKYIDYTTLSYDNLYDANTNEHLSGSNSLFNNVELFGNIGGSTLFVGDTKLIHASIIYAEVVGHSGYKIEADQEYWLEGNIFTNFFEGIEPTDYEDNDPYTDSEADDGGGYGTPDWSSDPISERSLPPNFYGNSGLVNVFTPTTLELQALSNYLWSDAFDIASFKKIVNNPFDLILALNYIPFLTTSAGSRAINVGNIVDTGLSMTIPSQENYMHDFGYLTLDEDEQAFIDYSPYTRVSIHLPFIGTQAIDIDLLRRNSKYNDTSFKLVYKYNIVNGSVVAYLYTANQKVLYEWAGNVATPIPVATNDFSNMFSGLASLASSAVSGAVTGGMIGSAVPGIGTAVGAVAGGVSGMAQGGLNTVASLKPNITTTGSVGSSASLLTSTNDAFILVEQPPLSIPLNYQGKLLGYPRNKSGLFKNSKGYNELSAIRIGSKKATENERNEIYSILTSGYIYGDSTSVNPLPTLPDDGDGVFTIGLYQTDSSNIRVDKSVEAVSDYTQVNIKDSTSIITPIVTLNMGNTNAIHANYCYIPAFERFYYIVDKTCLRGNLWQLTLRCDVLMSFRNSFENNEVIFKRSQYGWNLYLNDGSIQVDSRTRIKVKKFPNSLTNDGTYVLLMAGS